MKDPKSLKIIRERTLRDKTIPIPWVIKSCSKYFTLGYVAKGNAEIKVPTKYYNVPKMVSLVSQTNKSKTASIIHIRCLVPFHE